MMYALLSQDDSDDEKQSVNDDLPQSCRRLKVALLLLSVLLGASVGINIFVINKQLLQSNLLCNEAPSEFAHLVRNVPTEIVAHTDFDSLNRTVQDAAWGHPDVFPWNAVVALDEDYAISKALPHSQRWPWDQGKGVYILMSGHELHCVNVFRTYVNEIHDGVSEAEQTWHYPHLLHCLNVLRESIMCNADDRPMYIGRLHKNVHAKDPKAGVGMTKMCRNWTALQDWSRARTACYKPVNLSDNALDEIERYKYCWDGSRPWEAIEDS